MKIAGKTRVMYENVYKGKKSENSSPSYQTYTPIII